MGQNKTIVKEQMRIMDHYANGGKIESRIKTFDSHKEWVLMRDDTTICFNWVDFEYRIHVPNINEVVVKDLRYIKSDGKISVFLTEECLRRLEVIKGISDEVIFDEYQIIGYILQEPINGNYILFNIHSVKIGMSKDIDELMKYTFEYFIHKEDELYFMNKEEVYRMMSPEELITYKAINILWYKGVFNRDDFILKIVNNENKFKISIAVAQAVSLLIGLQYAIIDDAYILLTDNKNIDLSTDVGHTINIVNNFEITKGCLLDDTELLKMYVSGHPISLTSIEYKKLDSLKKYIKDL